MSPDLPGVDQDPLSPQSWSLYSYVRNNPLRYVDPTGRKCENGYNADTGAFCAETVGDAPDGLAEQAWRESQRFFAESWLNFERQFPRTSAFSEGSGQSVLTLFTSPRKSCVALFAAETVRNMNPFPAGDGLSIADLIQPAADVAAIVSWNSSLRYAASRPNYLGGRGLIYPMKSGAYRKMVARTGAFARVSLVAQEAYAMSAALVSEWDAAKSGECR
jgi:hypothetical protein